MNTLKMWNQYYNEQNFVNMEYQYNKIEEYLKEVFPLEDVLKRARTVENLHELIKNNGRNSWLNTRRERTCHNACTIK